MAICDCGECHAVVVDLVDHLAKLLCGLVNAIALFGENVAIVVSECGSVLL